MSARSIGVLCLAFFVSVRLLAQDTQTKHPATNNPHLGNESSIRSGMGMFRVACADCHGLDAGGYRGPDLIAALAGGMTDERLFDVIRKGVPGTEMPSRGTDTADDEILQVIAYLRKLGSVTS